MSTYAIGDIHGCYKALRLVFEHANFQPEDQIIFLGDYVDRGSGVMQTIDFLQEQSESFQLTFLKGNHEIMMLEARENQADFAFWYRNGGKATLQSYELDGKKKWMKKIKESHWEFLLNAKPYFSVADTIFVHGALQPGVPLKKQSPKYLYWQKVNNPPPYNSTNKIICGHTSQKDGKIADWGHTICIDTYAYGGYWLSCLNVDTGEYLQASELGTVKRGLLVNNE